MRYVTIAGRVLIVAAAAVMGAAAVHWLHPPVSLSAAQQTTASGGGAVLPEFRAEIDHLEAVAPSQGHAMTDVGYHFSNLWFAGQRQNWDLAGFYFDQTHSRLQWSIRIRPVRKDADGNDVDLQGIFDAVDTSVFSGLKQAIEEKDRVKFAAAYRMSLEACYACHRASGRPYLRPMVPLTPPQPIINFDPQAGWP